MRSAQSLTILTGSDLVITGAKEDGSGQTALQQITHDGLEDNPTMQAIEKTVLNPNPTASGTTYHAITRDILYA